MTLGFACPTMAWSFTLTFGGSYDVGTSPAHTRSRARGCRRRLLVVGLIRRGATNRRSNGDGRDDGIRRTSNRWQQRKRWPDVFGWAGSGWRDRGRRTHGIGRDDRRRWEQLEWRAHRFGRQWERRSSVSY